MSKITRTLGTTKLRLIQHGPTILTVVGIGTLIASGVVAALRNEKAAPVMDKLEVETTNWKKEAEIHPEYRNTEFQADMVISYKDAVVGFMKVYAPAIALAAVGSAAVLYSHGLMKKRNAAVVAAYGILERSFSSYRERVGNTVGEEIEEDIYLGKNPPVMTVDKKAEKVLTSQEPTRGGHLNVGTSEYAMAFGPDNPHWSSRPEYNLFFLRGQERYLNHQLQVRGHVMLNDVYDALRLPRTTAGTVVGWVYGEGDSYVDFGLPEQGSSEEADYYFFFDHNTEFLLDFNVDGLVYDKIDGLRK